MTIKFIDVAIHISNINCKNMVSRINGKDSSKDLDKDDKDTMALGTSWDFDKELIYLS